MVRVNTDTCVYSHQTLTFNFTLDILHPLPELGRTVSIPVLSTEPHAQRVKVGEARVLQLCPKPAYRRRLYNLQVQEDPGPVQLVLPGLALGKFLLPHLGLGQLNVLVCGNCQHILHTDGGCQVLRPDGGGNEGCRDRFGSAVVGHLAIAGELISPNKVESVWILFSFFYLQQARANCA